MRFVSLVTLVVFITTITLNPTDHSFLERSAHKKAGQLFFILKFRKQQRFPRFKQCPKFRGFSSYCVSVQEKFLHKIIPAYDF